MPTQIRYTPVMRDKAGDEFPSMTLLSMTEDRARENGKNAIYHLFTGRIATVTWEDDSPVSRAVTEEVAKNQ